MQTKQKNKNSDEDLNAERGLVVLAPSVKILFSLEQGAFSRTRVVSYVDRVVPVATREVALSQKETKRVSKVADLSQDFLTWPSVKRLITKQPSSRTHARASV